MGERADRLAEELDIPKLKGAARALAEEAVLVLGRLETLDAILKGSEDQWLGIRTVLLDGVSTIVIDAPLAESARQATVLKALLAELAKQTGAAKPVAVPVSLTDDLKAKREKRLQARESTPQSAIVDA